MDKTVEEAFKQYYRGSSFGAYKKIIWVSEDNKYALFKIPSHSEYLDRFSKTKSSPSEWDLVDVNLFKDNSMRQRDGVKNLKS